MSRPIRVAVFTVIAAVFVSGCGDQRQRANTPAPAARQAQQTVAAAIAPGRAIDFDGSEWEIIDKAARDSLVFHRDGQFSGDDGCNSVFGRWRTGAGQRIRFPLVGKTQMLCQGPVSTGVNLTVVRHWAATDTGELVLFDRRGRELARFRRIMPPTWDELDDRDAARQLEGRMCHLKDARIGRPPVYAGVLDSYATSTWEIGGVSDDDNCLAVRLVGAACGTVGPPEVEERTETVTMTVDVTIFRDLGTPRTCATESHEKWMGVPLERALGSRMIRDGCATANRHRCDSRGARRQCASPHACSIDTWLTTSTTSTSIRR